MLFLWDEEIKMKQILKKYNGEIFLVIISLLALVPGFVLRIIPAWI